MKALKILAGTIISLLVVLLLVFGTYYYFFVPKTEVKSTTDVITLDKKALILKFLPSDFKLNLKELYVESETEFSPEELTDLFIVAIQENPQLFEFITGLRVNLDNNLVNVIFHVNYKGIPFESKLVFNGESKYGKGIFHYVEGKIGFISIPKDFIFSKVEDTSFVKFDKNNGDIILSFDEIRNIKIENVSISNNNLKLIFSGTIGFWDWLKN